MTTFYCYDFPVTRCVKNSCHPTQT